METSKRLNHRSIGHKGELFVAHVLEQRGYTILTRNYTKQYGEIDIIARKNDLVLFVEVKFRSHPLFDPTELITPSKQRKIIRVAKEFISTHQYIYNLHETTYRFDVALVERTKDNIELSYIPNAFVDAYDA